MLINFEVAIVIASLTPKPPPEIVQLVEDIRMPDQSPPAHEIDA